MKYSVLCFAEGNTKIGMGHLFRIISIYKKYSKKINFMFVTSNQTQRDFYSRFDCTIIDIGEIDQLNVFNIGIYDSKEIYADTFYLLKSKASKWISIDSIQSWVKNFDVAVYPSFYMQKIDLPKEIDYASTEKKFGVDYILLNKSNKMTLTKDYFKTLVTFGGSDPNNITELVASYINNRSDRSEFRFLIGPKYVNSLSYFRNKFEYLDFLEPADGTFELIKNANIVITAVGTTLQECEFNNKKTLIISNYESDNNDIKKIKRSATNPLIYYFLDYYKNINEECFNNTYNELLDIKIKKYYKKTSWGRGWDKLLKVID